MITITGFETCAATYPSIAVAIGHLHRQMALLHCQRKIHVSPFQKKKYGLLSTERCLYCIEVKTTTEEYRSGKMTYFK